jgi:hypothetical protein
MRVLSEDEEHRLAIVDLVLDIRGSALICKKCEYSLSTTGSQVTSHLREKHQIAPEFRYGLTTYVRSLQLPDPAQLPLRPDGSLPHPHLRVHEGHACDQCEFRTTSLDLMTRHAREHLRCIQAARSKIDDLFRDVLLQSWVHGSSRQYWIVRWPENTCHLSSDLSTPSPVRAMHERERERIMAQADLAMETSPRRSRTLVHGWN